MTALIVKVENAIEYAIQNHGFGPHVSRAVIKAVAEWLGDETEHPAGAEVFAAAILKGQLEGSE